MAVQRKRLNLRGNKIRGKPRNQKNKPEGRLSASHSKAVGAMQKRGLSINLLRSTPILRAARAAALEEADRVARELAEQATASLPVLEHKSRTRAMAGPKPFVFVLMPFDAQFDDVYRLGIKEACASIGAYCERVDEQIFEERILDRIYNQIVKADVIVADMTGRNPNVFYEVGFAHALRKRVILLTQRSDDIPFDLKHFPHIIYEGRISDLREMLMKRVEWAVASIGSPDSPIDHPKLRYSIQGTQVVIGAKAHIIEYFEDESKNLVRICQLDVFNDSDSVIDTTQLQLSLVLEHYTGRTAVSLGGSRFRHLLPSLGEIFPGACVSSKLYLEPTASAPHKILTSRGVSAELHEVSRFGRRLIEFRSILLRRESLEFQMRWTTTDHGAAVRHSPHVEAHASVKGSGAHEATGGDASAQLNRQDALDRADFHMAYGQYQQAADLVKIAVEREPARRDLRLKLLEIYFVWGNRELFLDTARALHATRTEAPASEWKKVKLMGKQLAAEDPMFKLKRQSKI